MAVFDKVKTVSSPGITSVAKRCTVEIVEGSDAVLLSRRINGVVLDGPFAVNFIGL